ncbi:MAG: glycosyltransferase family 4 protein [Cyanobacteria bacterium P01_D01_bin.56]
MKILHLAMSEGSGAGRAALRLHVGLTNEESIESSVLTLWKSSDLPSVSKPNKQTSLFKITQAKLAKVAQDKILGVPEAFSANWTPSLTLNQIRSLQPDVINLHWVGWEFLKIEDLRQLNVPIVWTLQDMWPFTGGCHYSGSCDRYKQSCGSCPQIRGDRQQDLTHWVWKRKAKAWKDIDLTVVAPGTWIEDCAKASSLFQNRRIEVIPFCLDTERYKPVDAAIARDLLNLPQNKQLIIFGAFSATSDERKGFHLLTPALQQLSQTGWSDRVELAVFGASKPKSPLDLGFKAHYLGRLYDDVSLALLYSAADVMVVPSIQESFGQTASEALACGTPVVAFNATGLKDIVDHKQNGYLAQPYNQADLAEGIAWVLQDRSRHQHLRAQAREKALRAFALAHQAQRYRKLYQELMSITAVA